MYNRDMNRKIEHLLDDIYIWLHNSFSHSTECDYCFNEPHVYKIMEGIPNCYVTEECPKCKGIGGKSFWFWQIKQYNDWNNYRVPKGYSQMPPSF